jgi:membrane-bound serine protease (ClpP class)
MKTVLSLLLAVLALVSSVPPASAREEIRQGRRRGRPAPGEVSESMFLFLRRVQKAAEVGGASALVIDMNTYGGRLDSAEKITKLLHQAKIPTFTYINTNAGSAGALIALATKNIYMAPVSAIGAAAPVQSSGEDLSVTAKEKTISYWSALIRGSATRNGHNPDIGEAFMNKEKEVKIGDRIVHPKGTLLTLNAQEASEVIDGKPLLARGVADSINDLVRKAELKGNVATIKPAGFERLAFWITALAPLLLLGGMIGLYLEFKLPGTGLPGVVAAICFALFFLGHYFAGLAGWEVVALFVVGVALVLAEIFIFAHTTIIVGVVGVFLMLGALLWAMIDRYPGQRFLPTALMLPRPFVDL